MSEPPRRLTMTPSTSDAGAPRRAPRAFRVETATLAGDADLRPDVVPPRPVTPDVVIEPDETLDLLNEPKPERPLAPAAVVERSRSGWGLFGVAASALGGLFMLAVVLWAERVIVDLFALHPWLGWLGAGLAGLAGLALLALLWREVAAIGRARRVAEWQARAALAAERDSAPDAKRVVADIVALYAKRPETAQGRAALADLEDEIVDGRDRLVVTERELLAPLDLLVAEEIAFASRRVALVTAISPRALVDLLFVGAQSVRLVRRISAIYGGRPGGLGFLRIGRSVLTHLALTGGIAVTDSVVQQLLGQGLAARLSAKLGEGVLNGLLTARVGVAAMGVCRPLPFLEREPPSLTELAGSMVSSIGWPGAEARKP